MPEPNDSSLVLLVGEQPAPNLLPTRHLKPDEVVLVYTTRTEKVAQHLEALLAPSITCLHCMVHPYRLNDILDTLTAFIAEHLSDHELIFNLTGGTKPMAMATFELARSLHRPIVYFQSEGNTSKLYTYTFADAPASGIRAEEPVTLSASMSLDDYLRIYLGSYTTESPRNPFEEAVFELLDALEGVDEVFTGLRPQGMAALEVDFVLRCGNQIGIGEVKSQGNKKTIDQLNGVAQQRYLGTYVRKFLISAHAVDDNNKVLAEAYRTQVVELLSYGRSGKIDAADAASLADTVLSTMGVRT